MPQKTFYKNLTNNSMTVHFRNGNINKNYSNHMIFVYLLFIDNHFFKKNIRLPTNYTIIFP